MATWDNTNAFKAMTLSGGNLIATSTGSTIDSCRSSDSKSTGKWYVKIEATTVHTDQVYRWVMALQGGSYNPNTADNIEGFESSVNSICRRRDGQVMFQNGANGAGFVSALTSGDFIEFAMDIDALKWWTRRLNSAGTPDASGWNPGEAGTPDPTNSATGVSFNPGGDYPTFAAPPWYFAFCSAGDSGNAATIMTNGTPPTGYTDWNAAGGATTVTGDRSGNIGFQATQQRGDISRVTRWREAVDLWVRRPSSLFVPRGFYPKPA